MPCSSVGGLQNFGVLLIVALALPSTSDDGSTLLFFQGTGGVYFEMQQPPAPR